MQLNGKGEEWDALNCLMVSSLESKVVVVSLGRKTNEGQFFTIWVFYLILLQGRFCLVWYMWLISQDIKNVNTGHLRTRQRWGLMEDEVFGDDPVKDEKNPCPGRGRGSPMLPPQSAQRCQWSGDVINSGSSCKCQCEGRWKRTISQTKQIQLNVFFIH